MDRGHLYRAASAFTAVAPIICSIIAQLQLSVAPAAKKFCMVYAAHREEDIDLVWQEHDISSVAGDAEKVSPGAVDAALAAHWECMVMGSELESIEWLLHYFEGRDVDMIFTRDKTSADVTVDLLTDPAFGTAAHYIPVVFQMQRIRCMTTNIKKVLDSLYDVATDEDIAAISADAELVALTGRCRADVCEVYKLNLALEGVLSDLSGYYES